MDGALLDAEFEASVFVYDVSQQLATTHKANQQVSARLTREGALLPPGFRLSECALKEDDLIDVIFVAWTPPLEQSRLEVLPRRTIDALCVNETHLDASGIFTRSSERHEMAVQLASNIRPSLIVLDIRQCGLSTESLLQIFELLPESLQELWAGRNHFDGQVLECLQQKSLKLRVLDIGYSSCENMQKLPDLVTELTEQLMLGDLDDMEASVFEAALAKCPHLRLLDIFNNDSLERSFGVIAQCSQLRQLLAKRVEFPIEGLKQILHQCLHLEHLVIENVQDLSVVRSLAKLNLKVLQVAVVETGQILPAIVALKVETLMISLQQADGDADASLAFMEDVGPLVESFKSSPATCLALEAAAVDLEILEAIGTRLCSIGQGWDSASNSILSSLAKTPLCCVNLLSLSINYFEQIDPKELAQVAAACPMLRDLSLNADDDEFQVAAIDEGVLALGQHCHKLEHLDMYDRIMAQPAQTVMTACEGWPLLRYLCMAGCTREDWETVEQIHELPVVLATKCPKIQEVVIYDDEMTQLFDAELGKRCALYGRDFLDFETDSEDCSDED